MSKTGILIVMAIVLPYFNIFLHKIREIYTTPKIPVDVPNDVQLLHTFLSN